MIKSAQQQGKPAAVFWFIEKYIPGNKKQLKKLEIELL